MSAEKVCWGVRDISWYSTQKISLIAMLRLPPVWVQTGLPRSCYTWPKCHSLETPQGNASACATGNASGAGRGLSPSSYFSLAVRPPQAGNRRGWDLGRLRRSCLSSRLYFSYHPISEGPKHVWRNTKWRCNSVKIIAVSKTQGKMKL